MNNRIVTGKKPEWLKVSYNRDAVEEVSALMGRLKLNTVCKEANCPNLGECFKKQTATFMILGSVCTRQCRFCNVTKGSAQMVDEMEPQHLAEAVKSLALKHVVITSVTRDDLADGGASHFARCIEAVRRLSPETTIEVLIPDFIGNEEALDMVIAASPEVINHNVETVRSLYEKVRPQADYDRSMAVIAYVKEKAPHIMTKTGIMVGLGETDEEVYAVMDDSRKAGCDIFTVGQYLRPSEAHLMMVEYVEPSRFETYRKAGEARGFRYVASSPLVRSSYQAGEALEKGRRKTT
ncbi:MAG TPA: lipoyl synthase [Clostridiaceae bacterium]|nr:lipoyl synthase [Clostridiaceae bacterium]